MYEGYNLRKYKREIAKSAYIKMNSNTENQINLHISFKKTVSHWNQSTIETLVIVEVSYGLGNHLFLKRNAFEV